MKTPILTAQHCQALGRWLTQYTKKDKLNPVCLAITNPEGALQYFLRQDHAPLRTIAIAQAKAYTATRMGTSTLAFQKRLQVENLQLQDFVDS